ncbi:hypothetical protein TrVFT333_009955 [Trichoderma virens FT-333]|nr:hypothetical protein TrVFT333_009955 [Trichoderma virens FT-333]
MADRRRVNGPGGSSLPPVYDDGELDAVSRRQRAPDAIRPLYRSYPSASGSAYLEIEPREGEHGSGMKLTCTVHGPRSLPRSAPFSPYMVLSTHVKFAPFATKQRRGYLRDSSEKDLSTHLETALRGAMIADRWPKSGVDVVDAVERRVEEWDVMNVLGGCITVASAAIADAGIDCVDTVSGGVAALVAGKDGSETSIVLDPVALEHESILAACCVAYLPNRDEITNLWFKGRLPSTASYNHQSLVSRAVQASKGTHGLISASLSEVIGNSQN